LIRSLYARVPGLQGTDKGVYQILQVIQDK
jgi:hypothetical protein